MLEFIKLKNPQSVYNILEQFNPQTTTWIVSDLKSKSEIQNKIIQQNGFFIDTSILRGSDFWKMWLRRLAPEIQIVSTDFLKSLIEVFVELYGDKLDLNKSDASTLFIYLSELAPILLIPNSEKILQEWFDQIEKGQQRNKKKTWYRWFLVSKVCLKFIIIENKVIESRWISAYLQALDLNKLIWSQDIIVDLGSEMTSVEMSLFKILAQKTKVQILTPHPDWKDQFPYLLKTYSDNEGYGKVNSVAGSEKSRLDSVFIRVSTQLAEVKHAVSLVRKWCDSGTLPEKISIISPDIEHYWPSLKYYLNQEGIPTQKDEVCNLASLNLFQMLLSYINNTNLEINWDSLETNIFSTNKEPQVSFEQFKSLFYLMIDEDDLERDVKIKKLFYKKINFQQSISRDEFLAVLIKIWVQNELAVYDFDSEYFKVLFKDLVSQCSNMTMKAQYWFKYLEQRIKNKEIKISDGARDGIKVVSLMSSHLLDSTHQVWIGLDEKMLSINKKMILPISDAIELKKNFDFSIQLPEESFYDFNIRWQKEKNADQKIFICAHTAFDSSPLSSSLFFIENVKNNEIQDPDFIRFDEIQKNLNYQIFNGAIEDKEIEKIKDEILNVKPNIKDIIFSELSATDLEEYWKCPFKFLARKGFKLKDLPYVGLDLDPRQKGTISHQLFDYLISEIKQNNPLSESLIGNKLDQMRDSLGIFKQQEILWQIQRKKYIQIAEKFIAFESEHTSLNNLATEKDFQIFFDLQSKKFSPTTNTISIKGRIDRIDAYKKSDEKKDNQQIVIFDYKNSTNDLSNYKGFIKNGEFQLLLYAVACELVLYPNSDVVAAVYYDSRLFKTNKGFMSIESAPDLYKGTKVPSQVKIDEEQKIVLMEEFMSVVFNLLQKIENKNFLAEPQDVELCKTCDWNKICRAPHLIY